MVRQEFRSKRVRNYRNLSPCKHGALGCFIRQPLAGSHDSEIRQIFQRRNFCFLMPFNGRLERKFHGRAVCALRFVLSAIEGIVASTSEGIHVVERPDNPVRFP